MRSLIIALLIDSCLTSLHLLFLLVKTDVIDNQHHLVKLNNSIFFLLFDVEIYTIIGSNSFLFSVGIDSLWFLAVILTISRSEEAISTLI